MIAQHDFYRDDQCARQRPLRYEELVRPQLAADENYPQNAGFVQNSGNQGTIPYRGEGAFVCLTACPGSVWLYVLPNTSVLREIDH